MPGITISEALTKIITSKVIDARPDLRTMDSANSSEDPTMQKESAARWLKAASLITIGFGLLIAAAAYPATSTPVEFLTDLIFYPVDGAERIAGREIRLLNAICGGVMFGWGVMLYLTATKVYPQYPKLGRQIILTGIVSWFIVDSTGSALSGAPLNVLFNAGFLLMFCLPLMMVKAEN
jgi:hypothetical protein